MQCNCEEQHVEDCPAYEAEKQYWANYFGITPEMNREERRRQLDFMRPYGCDPIEMEDE